jgi:hypothetical protein
MIKTKVKRYKKPQEGLYLSRNPEDDLTPKYKAGSLTKLKRQSAESAPPKTWPK